jgi:S1-C subfamily serine protease
VPNPCRHRAAFNERPAIRGLWRLAFASASIVAGCREVEDPATYNRPLAAQATTERQERAAPSLSAPNKTFVVPDFTTVVEEVGPSVVTVIATLSDSHTDRHKVLRGLGSGMIVTVGGQVLTNEHVVSSATRVDIELSSRDRLPAKVLVADPLLDLALLQVESPVGELQPIVFRDREPRPGQWVMAIGQPFGLGHTVTVGVISGLGRDHDDLGRPQDLDPNGIWSFIQTDASINIGNSGGPLVDMEGRVVGITTAVRSDGQGLAFAVPAQMGRKFLEEAWTYGRVRKARLGLDAESAAPPESLHNRGTIVRVKRVEPHGAAAKAGLGAGDLILAVNDKPVSRLSEVAYLTQLEGVGARVTLTIKRANQPAEQVVVIPAEGR